MAQALLCPLGHQWIAETVAGDPSICPVCGGVAVAPTMDNAAPSAQLPPVPDTNHEAPTGAMLSRPKAAGESAPAATGRESMLPTPTIDGSATAPPAFAATVDQPSVPVTCAPQITPTVESPSPDARYAPTVEAQHLARPGISLGWGDLDEVAAPPLNARSQVAIPGYEILGELGRGGMGVVYKARQIQLNRLVAIKMIITAQASQRALERFRREAEAVAQFQHPNIVQIYEVGEHEGRPYFSLEFVNGQSLAHHIAGKPQQPHASAELVEQLAWAMQAAHQHGIIHRDLKPANVLMHLPDVPAGGAKSWSGAETEILGTTQARATKARWHAFSSAIPKITDFGIAKRLGEQSGTTQAGEAIGTPSYMAPEQAQGRLEDIGPATDVYALGGIFYELLTGRPPFQGESLVETMSLVTNAEPIAPRSLHPQVPFDLETICLKCLEKDPKKRFASAAALAEDLRRFLNGEPIKARPIGPIGRGIKWAKRRPAMASLLTFSILAAVGTIGGLYVHAEHQRESAETERKLKDDAMRLKEAAERAREQADKNAKLANDNFKLALENFRKARQAVDEMLTRVAQEHLAHVPAMAAERKRLLQAALNFYQNQTPPQGHLDDPELRRETARANRRVGEINQLLGEFVQADKAFQRSVPMTEALQRDYPQSPEYRQDLGLVYFFQGKLRQKQSQMAEAETDFRKALAVQLQLTTDSSAAAYRADLARTYNEIGLVLRQTNRVEAAKEAYDKAVALQTQLTLEQGDGAEFIFDLAGSLNDRANILRLLKQVEPAEADYKKALGFLSRLVELNPENVQYRSRLGAVYQNLGLALSRIRTADAEAALRKATELGKELVISFPTVPDFRYEQAKALTNLAAEQGRGNNFAEADKNFRQAKEHLDRLITDANSSPEFSSTMGVTLDYWAMLLRSQSRDQLPEARKLLFEALPHHERAFRANPNNPAFRQRLANHYIDLAEVCLGQDALADAAKAAQDLHRLAPEDMRDSRRAAELLARCSAQAKEKTAADDYAKQAVQILAEAARRRQVDAAYLQATKSFEPLLSREDFKKLLADVTAKQ